MSRAQTRRFTLAPGRWEPQAEQIRWESNTLVVETTDITPNTTGFGGATMSDAARLVERFTRVDPDTINCEITVHDPKTYTKPFTVAVPIRQEPSYS